MRTLGEAGADLAAPAVGMWHRETPLHWAASNDDVALIDALLDAGANIEAAGSSMTAARLCPAPSGTGNRRRLVERGARTLFWHEAALASIPATIQRVEADPPPQPEQFSGPFWNACYGGQLAVPQYLLVHGADLNWPAPWSGQTPLDIAERAAQNDIVASLLGKGAIYGD